MDKFPPPALIVNVPVKLTTVPAVVAVPVIDKLFAEMAALLVTAVVLEFEFAVIDTAPTLLMPT